MIYTDAIERIIALLDLSLEDEAILRLCLGVLRGAWVRKGM